MNKLLAFIVLFLTFASRGNAEDPFNSTTIYWENDSFGIGRQSDRFYTNGVRIDLGFAKHPFPGLLGDFRNNFCNHVWCGEGKANSVEGVFIGQNFYTPEIITIAAPQPRDRPWAGSLYAGFSETISDEGGKVQHVFEGSIGVLGPGAGAQGTQKFVHNTLGFSNNDPQGWRNQLRNEPTFGLLYRQSRPIFFQDPTQERNFDITPEFGGLLGTLQTYANAGGTIRLGRHISGFISSVIPGAAAESSRRSQWEVYAFLGGEGRWVPFNATLNGGFFRNGPKANDPKRFVADWRYGVSGRYKRFRLTYSVVNRSPEFKVPRGHIGIQRFGSYVLTFEPRSSS
jgi:lipid A 3-O-deacylase